jgi:hypothetical protein
MPTTRRLLTALLAALFFCGLSALRVEGAEDDPVTPEQLKEAVINVQRAEYEFVKASIELEQLRGRDKVAHLQEHLEKIKSSLAEKGVLVEDNDTFVQKWLVLGPIPVDEKVNEHDEEHCKSMLDRLYVPADARPKLDDTAKIDGTEFSWKDVPVDEYYVDLAKFAEDASKKSENAAYLGVVYVTCEAEQTEVKLAIGSDDDSVWRLNGTEVIRAYEGRGVDKDQNTAENLTLKKGVNVLAFTVLNGEGGSAAAARFLDKDNHNLTGVTYSTQPPETAN